MDDDKDQDQSKAKTEFDKLVDDAKKNLGPGLKSFGEKLKAGLKDVHKGVVEGVDKLKKPDQ